MFTKKNNHSEPQTTKTFEAANSAPDAPKKKAGFTFFYRVDDKDSAFKVARYTQFVAFYIAFSYLFGSLFLWFSGHNMYESTEADPFVFYGELSFHVIIVSLFLWLGIRVYKGKLGAVPYICAWLFIEILLKQLLLPGKGIATSLFFSFIAINGLRGWMAFRKYQPSEVAKRPFFKRWGIIASGAVVTLIFIFLLSVGTLVELGVIPDTKILTADEITPYQRDTLVEHSIISPSDNVTYFYSDGTFDMLEHGTLLTDDTMISYETVDTGIMTYEIPLEHIEKVELLEQGDFFTDSVYKIYSTVPLYEEFVISLSAEGEVDKLFFEALTRHTDHP